MVGRLSFVGCSDPLAPAATSAGPRELTRQDSAYSDAGGEPPRDAVSSSAPNGIPARADGAAPGAAGAGSREFPSRAEDCKLGVDPHPPEPPPETGMSEPSAELRERIEN